MKEFKNDEEKRQFLIPIISRYRIFLMKYLNLTKTELIEQLSKRLDKSQEECHLKAMNLEACDKMIRELKEWKRELTGVKNLPKNVNPRDYAKKLLGEYKMKVVEIFCSIDGEGKRAGELATFIRLYGCNLRCEYCDTRYSYEQETSDLPYKEMSITEIIEECNKYETNNITLTGGEPLIHLDVEYLLRALSELNYNVNVETNGSVDLRKYYNDNGDPKPGYENVWFTVDYKCGCSGMTDKMCNTNFNLRDGIRYSNIVYKFVVGSQEDLEQAYNIIAFDILANLNKNCYIYLSPVFGKIEPKDIVQFMLDKNLYCENTPIRCQLQLHKYIWDVTQRGV